jgi:hypothetical protein
VAYQRNRAADKARGAIDPLVPQGIDAAPGLRGSPDVARQLFHEPFKAAETVRAPTLFIDAEFEEYADLATHGQIAEVVKRQAPCERVTFPCTHYKVYDEFYEPALQLALDWFNKHLAESGA